MTSKTNVIEVQKHSLIECLQSKPNMIKGKFHNQYSRRNWLADWEEVAQALNSDKNGPTKSATHWAMWWKNQRNLARNKYGQLCKTRGKTGGGPPSTKSLTSFEEAILSLVNDVVITGDPKIQESESSFLLEAYNKNNNNNEESIIVPINVSDESGSEELIEKNQPSHERTTDEDSVATKEKSSLFRAESYKKKKPGDIIAECSQQDIKIKEHFYKEMLKIEKERLEMQRRLLNKVENSNQCIIL